MGLKRASSQLTWRRGALALATAGLISMASGAVLWSTGGPAQSAAPPGNNGDIKIAEAVDDVPGNDPHVPCTFHVEWYGFDAKAVSTVRFETQPPTGGTVTWSGLTEVVLEDDPAGGGTDLDAREPYTLAFSDAPHPQQGWHAKLTVTTTGSQGNDTKSKVFWVQGCTGPTETVPTETTPTETTPTETTPTETTPTETTPTETTPTESPTETTVTESPTETAPTSGTTHSPGVEPTQVHSQTPSNGPGAGGPAAGGPGAGGGLSGIEAGISGESGSVWGPALMGTGAAMVLWAALLALGGGRREVDA